MPPSYIFREVVKLASGSNWNVWKIDMKMYFMGEEAWAIVSGVDKRPTPTSDPDNSEDVAKWEKAATTFLSTIYFACTQDVRVKIQHCETAPDAWKILREEFEKDIPSTSLALHTEFQSVVHDVSKPVTVYTNRILDLADQLGALNRRPSDEVISDTMLAHLDPTFSEIMTTLSSVDKIAAPKDVAAKLDAWERTRKVAAISREKAAGSSINDSLSIGGSSVALAAQENGLNNWGNRCKDPKACNRCGLRGHFAHECNVQMPAHIQEKVRAKRTDRRHRSHSARHDMDSSSSSGSDTSTSSSRSPSPPPHNRSSKSSSLRRQKAHHATIRTLRVL